MRELKLSATELVESLLNLPQELNLCLLDSCGVPHLGSHLLIAGIDPLEVTQITGENPEKTLEVLSRKVSDSGLATIFTLSYDFGLKINRTRSRHPNPDEPDVFFAQFDALVVHDYQTKTTYVTGNERKFDQLEQLLRAAAAQDFPEASGSSTIVSNFTRPDYLAAIEEIQEYIRRGDTYQTNLTQQIRARLPEDLPPEIIFRRLRRSHPAPFASFIRRRNDIVISASPERFLKVENGIISTSPIKGTRPRGRTPTEDSSLKSELLNSEKDRAENIMIVDLLRNDLGRICEFGSIQVEKLCELEEHPTLFHLVSTIAGRLRPNVDFAEVLRAAFPCGSITGAPKIRTMQIIDKIETTSRGLSMGAIGFWISDLGFGIGPKTRTAAPFRFSTLDSSHSTLRYCDLSVAIRTMVIRGREAVFNVGGGIVIDSVPENEYDETLVKARALLRAINADVRDLDDSFAD
jgi:para-aminobenzoate synthetase component 1